MVLIDWSRPWRRRFAHLPTNCANRLNRLLLCASVSTSANQSAPFASFRARSSACARLNFPWICSRIAVCRAVTFQLLCSNVAMSKSTSIRCTASDRCTQSRCLHPRSPCVTPARTKKSCRHVACARSWLPLGIASGGAGGTNSNVSRMAASLCISSLGTGACGHDAGTDA